MSVLDCEFARTPRRSAMRSWYRVMAENKTLSVGIDQRPGQASPELSVVGDVWPDHDPEQVLGVGDAGHERCGHYRHDQILG